MTVVCISTASLRASLGNTRQIQTKKSRHSKTRHRLSGPVGSQSGHARNRKMPLAGHFTPFNGKSTGLSCTGWAKKCGHRLTTSIPSNLNRFKKTHWRFLSKFEAKWIFKIPPHLAYVATLPRETVMSAKKAINDRLQGIYIYLRCGGVLNNQITKGLLLSCD